MSTEKAEGNSLIKLEGSEYKKEDDSGKESEETPLPLPLAREVSDASLFLHEARLEDGETKKAEVCEDERDTESMLQKTESRTENREDVHVNSEDTKAPDSVDKISEGGIIDAAAEKDETVEVQVRYYYYFMIISFIICISTKKHLERSKEQGDKTLSLNS